MINIKKNLNRYYPFKLRRITYLCENKLELIKIQRILLKSGYEWKSSGKKIITIKNNLPIVICNYTDNGIGSKYLICDDYNTNKRYYNFKKSSQVIRNFKIIYLK